jgi:DNA-binding HxlR family transcriptional regulator
VPALPAPGRGDAFLADCPVRLAIDLLGHTWTIVVLHALRHGALRPYQLRGRIGGISAKALNDTLRRLEHQGLVSRHRIAAAPPRVDYRLTQLGASLLGPLDVLAGWVAEHAHDLPDGATDPLSGRSGGGDQGWG